MTPADRAVAWGMRRGSGALPHVAWTTRDGEAAAWWAASVGWVTATDDDIHEDEDAALTAYLDAVGAP